MVRIILHIYIIEVILSTLGRDFERASLSAEFDWDLTQKYPSSISDATLDQLKIGNGKFKTYTVHMGYISEISEKSSKAFLWT
jgi:hypothetical protein